MFKSIKYVIGSCLGASSISFVRIKKDNDLITIEDVLTLPHNGDPRKVFKDQLIEFTKPKEPVLSEINTREFLREKPIEEDEYRISSLDLNENIENSFFNIPIVVTGRKFRKLVKFTNISEPEATEYAFTFLNKNKEEFSAVASLGGETFMVYPLDEEGKISNVITRNQCASGTGEFFLQQIKRMNLGIDEVVDIAKDAEPFKVSGRCSVFCKSDCTHALNKGVRKSEVTSGLSLMMAEKVEDLLKKVKPGKVMVVGGVTKNSVVMNFLQEKIPDIHIPAEASYFEALGAALYGLENEVNIN